MTIKGAKHVYRGGHFSPGERTAVALSVRGHRYPPGPLDIKAWRARKLGLVTADAFGRPRAISPALASAVLAAFRSRCVELGGQLANFAAGRTFVLFVVEDLSTLNLMVSLQRHADMVAHRRHGWPRESHVFNLLHTDTNVTEADMPVLDEVSKLVRAL